LSGGREQGCFIPVAGDIAEASRVMFCQGWASGCTLAAAWDPAILICADNDAGTEDNPGLTRAIKAVRAVGGLLAVPDFGPGPPDGATDFNDMARVRGWKPSIEPWRACSRRA
jgi:putative DNA primase/helicase